MNTFPHLSYLKQIDEKFNTVALSTTLPLEEENPLDILSKLQSVSKHCFLLESCEDRKHWGRYTYIGFDPSLEITMINNKLNINSATNIEIICDKPHQYIRNILNEYKSPKIEGLPPFTGGLVGYFSYDFISYSEPILKLDAKDDEKFNNLDLMLFDKIIAIDNVENKIYLIVNIKTNNIDTNYEKGLLALQNLLYLLKNGKKKEEDIGILKEELTPLFSKSEFVDMVKKAKKHIVDGDIFQVVLSNSLSAPYEGSLKTAYKYLRKTNPSPYMFYFSSDEIEIAGASPETLVKLDGKKLSTYPLAGTRKRGKTAKEDKELEMDLLSDEKEIAEHNMLVDLGRNDIGRISKIGSVKVEKYMKIERFSHVMHIASTVSGEIEDGLDSLDAIDSILPAGTLSGAPKIKACQIINELENNKRGIYGGAIGYLAFNGSSDTCIAIRLVFKKNGKIHIRSGAGIVADSVAESEYEECINKARAVVNALKEN
jgi:anthranilate synthase component 1